MKKIIQGKRQLRTLILLSFMLFSAFNALGQITITGKITMASDNSPMPGVTVLISGTTKGTVSDVDGNYKIEVPDNTASLQFSMVGMLTETVEVDSKTVIDVAMSEDLVGLDEVVVIGYGTMKKGDISGAIVSAGEKEITEVKSANFMESLQGKMSGVDITPDGGQSGAGVGILIRGKRSLIGSNDPLFIVDGVPYSSDLNLNPNDIQSVQVLKDASSTAIYGSRGANGVILITTKKGTSGTSKVFLNAYVGFTQPYQRVPVFDRAGYIKAKTDATRDTSNNYANWNTDPNVANVFTSVAELKGYNDGTYTDWQDIVTQNGLRQEYQLGASGGKDNLSYNTSLSYYDEKGIILADKFKRYTFKINVDGKINNVISAGGSTILTYRQRDGRGVRFTDAVLLSPIVPCYDTTGKYLFQPDVNNSRRNPLVYTDDKQQLTDTKILSSMYAQLNFSKDLYFKSNIGIDIEPQRLGFMYPKTDPNDDPTTTGVILENDFAYTWTNLLNYSKALGSSSLNITIGHELHASHNEYYTMGGKNQPDEGTLWWALGSVDQSTNTSSSGVIDKRLVSAFGRASLNIKDLLLLNGTGRVDGASQLVPGNYWSFFPSFSAALKLKNIEYFKNLSTISDIKFRAGYGVSGNAAVNAYATAGVVNKYPIHYQFGHPGAEINYDGFRPEFLASKSLHWEYTKQYNIGLDFGIFQNRITGTIDAYKSQTTDDLVNSKVPPSTGFFSVVANSGKVDTKGFEVMLQTVNIDRAGLKWDMDISYSIDRQKIVAISEGVDQDIANGWFVGHPIDVYYDYKKIGIWQLDEEAQAAKNGQRPGDIKVLNKDNDTLGTITADDRVILGNQRPKWTASWVNTFSYKGIDLTLNFYARMGQMIDAEAYAFDPRMYDNMLAINYWTPNNPTNEYPRLYKGLAEMEYEYSLRYRDGSFIKLKNFTLGYSLPTKWVERLSISKIRFYFTSNNPLILYSKLAKGLDPERNGSISWPLARTTVFGLNVEF